MMYFDLKKTRAAREAHEAPSQKPLTAKELKEKIKAMKTALEQMARGCHPSPSARLGFDELYAEVGFADHYEWEARFSGAPDTTGGRDHAQGAKKRKAVA